LYFLSKTRTVFHLNVILAEKKFASDIVCKCDWKMTVRRFILPIHMHEGYLQRLICTLLKNIHNIVEQSDVSKRLSTSGRKEFRPADLIIQQIYIYSEGICLKGILFDWSRPLSE